MSIYLLIAIAVVIIIGLVIIPKHYPYLEKRTAASVWLHLDFDSRETVLLIYKDASRKELVERIVLKTPRDIVGRGSFLPPREGDTTGSLYRPKNIEEVTKRVSLAAKELMQRFDGAIDYDIEEFTPFEAGRIAYGLGRGEEDNPYRDNEELGIEWEAGYCEAFRLDREN